jgi:hypothetical protein
VREFLHLFMSVMLPMFMAAVDQTLTGRDRLGAAAAAMSLSRSSGAMLGTTLFGARSYGLLHGIDLDAALRGTASDRALILAAFRRGFIAAAMRTASRPARRMRHHIIPRS